MIKLRIYFEILLLCYAWVHNVLFLLLESVDICVKDTTKYNSILYMIFKRTLKEARGGG